MGSITLHNLDDKLEHVIRKRANKENLSLNKMMQIMLKESVGFISKKEEFKVDNFSEFCGIWNKKEFNDFQKKIKNIRKINPKDWQ